MRIDPHTPKSQGTPTPTASNAPSSRHALLICIVLIFGTLALYRQVTDYPFISVDDPTYVAANRHVQHGLTLESVRWALTTFHAGNWHPLTWLSHMTDIQLYALNPSGHHLTSLLLHIANSVLLFLLLRRMTGSTWRSGFAAGLFALHPLHVESVAWVAERKDVLSTLFWMLTLWAYAAYAARRSVARYLLVLILFALGLVAKPMLVSLPLMMLALDFWPLKRLASDGARMRSLLLEKVPLIAMGLAASVVTVIAQRQGGGVRSFDTYPMGVRVANALVAYVGYIREMLWPSDLTNLYPHPGSTLPAWQVAASGLILALLTYAALRLRRSHPYLIFGWSWFVVTLVPVIGLLQVGGQAMADRYTYIPLTGLFVAIAWGVPDLPAKRLKLDHRHLIAPAAIVLAILAFCVSLQVACWRSDHALLDRAMRSTGGNYVVRCWMADYLIGQDQTSSATRLLSSATDDGRPGFAQARNALGCILIGEGKLKEAEAEYREALRVRPSMAEAHNNLGTLLAKQGKINEALKEFLAALRVEPYYVGAQLNAALALASQGKTSAALEHFGQAIRSEPDNTDARCRASVLLIQLGRTSEAIPHLRAALEADPKLAEAQFLLGTALQRDCDLDGAIQHFSKAVELREDWGLAHASLAMALFTRGDYATAWRETRLAERYKHPLPTSFLKALANRMAEPR